MQYARKQWHIVMTVAVLTAMVVLFGCGPAPTTAPATSAPPPVATTAPAVITPGAVQQPPTAVPANQPKKGGSLS